MWCLLRVSSWIFTNQRRVLWSHDHYWQIRGVYCYLVILVRGRWPWSRCVLGNLKVKRITTVSRARGPSRPIRGQYSVFTCLYLFSLFSHLVSRTKLGSCMWSLVLPGASGRTYSLQTRTSSFWGASWLAKACHVTRVLASHWPRRGGANYRRWLWWWGGCGGFWWWRVFCDLWGEGLY